MTEPLSWSFSLGRWAGTEVRVHALLPLFAASKLLGALMTPGLPVAETAAWLGLLVVALALHEIGHAAMAASRGLDVEEVRLWPLGNFATTPATGAPGGVEPILVALAGPLMSGLWAVVSAVGLNLSDAQIQLNPFAGNGAPRLLGSNETAAPLTAVWCVGWFGYLNGMIFLLNLIPALPMDGGRMLRAAWRDYSADSLVPAWTARASAIVLLLVGGIRMLSYDRGVDQAFALIGLAILIEVVVRAESRSIDDGGVLDDGVFGYDFSQGYTSLDRGTPLVRPTHEGAIRRWRRRRSDLRQIRLAERDAAEERRMDEILAKLHREGRAGLSDAERRFLVRASIRLRTRLRARG